MSKESFEQMDQDFEKIFRPHKEARVPDELLKDFDTQVKRRILDRKSRAFPFGIAYAALAVLVLTIAAFGLFFWKINLPTPRPVAEPVAAVSSQAPIQSTPETADLEESDLLTEIAALQELGVWTEADDDSIGISIEQSLSELELGLETESFPLQSNPQFLR